MQSAKKTETITGVLTRIRYYDAESQWGVYRLMDSDGRNFEATGRYPTPHLFEQVVLTGKWVCSPETLPELAFDDVIAQPPEDLEYLPTYLSALLKLSINDGIALVRMFGRNTVTVLDSNPEALKSCPLQGVAPESLRERWLDTRGFDQIKNQLELKGIPDSAISTLVRHVGPKKDLNRVLRDDPYLLYRISDNLSFDTIRKFATHFNCRADSISSIKGTIIAVLRACLNIRGTKHISKTELCHMVKSKQFLNSPSLPQKKIITLTQEMHGKELFISGDEVQLMPVYQAQHSLVQSLYHRGTSSSQNLTTEVVETGFTQHLTIAEYSTYDQFESWLSQIEAKAKETGAHLLIITSSPDVANVIDGKFDSSVASYMDILQPHTDTTALANNEAPFEADIVIVTGAHLIPDAALVLITHATHPKAALIMAGSTAQWVSPIINTSFNALPALPMVQHLKLDEETHCATQGNLPTDFSKFELNDPVSWLFCQDDKLVESAIGLASLFAKRLHLSIDDINIVCITRYLNGEDLAEKMSEAMKTAELESNMKMLVSAVWDRGLAAFTRYESHILSEINKQFIQTDCLPIAMALNTYAKLTILLVPTEHSSLLNRDVILLLKDTCSDNFIVLGDISSASSRYDVKPKYQPTPFKHAIGKLHEISSI